MDHNEVPYLHVCLTSHISFPNQVQEAKVETHKNFNSNSVLGTWKTK